MTYAQNGLIQAVDYGTSTTTGLIGSVNSLLGTGSGQSGYGQSGLVLPAIAAADPVTANQWSLLISRINTISQHQTGAVTGLTGPTAGTLISYLSTLNSTINTLTANKLLVHGVGTPVAATPVQNATAWNSPAAPGGLSPGCIKETTWTWSGGADAMRWFFNMGGYVTFTGANSVLHTNTKSDDWDALLAACGTIRINATTSQKEGGSGTPSVINTNLGFYNLGTAYGTNTVVLKQYSTTATGGYLNNYAIFEAKLNAVAGSATALTMKMSLWDDATDDGTSQDAVLGTVRFDYAYVPPLTTYLANTWGTITTTVNNDLQG